MAPDLESARDRLESYDVSDMGYEARIQHKRRIKRVQGVDGAEADSPEALAAPPQDDAAASTES